MITAGIKILVILAVLFGLSALVVSWVVSTCTKILYGSEDDDVENQIQNSEMPAPHDEPGEDDANR